ncbi:uncharacterized protein LOC119616091 isoform X2 [Lucilia sericata]|uniref:uncharacterized protein LOC119616091 isoform X2 n=1 Tax=Lucilia sericata TaxID=13632 RepID=UPI0018A86CBD|nr:uncharacterized protein LOC119616091 isoform X2 [Lucilia sericata]
MSNFSKQHFGDIDIRQLIHHYKQYDCLWNFNSPDYKNKSSKQEAWSEIANYFQKDVNEVKRKVKYLRTAYVAEKKKVEASRKSGNNTPYKPSLFYYKDLNFLEDVVVWRKFGNEVEHNELEFITAEAVEDEELLKYVNQEEEEDVDLKQPGINCKTETYIDAEPESSPPRQIRNTPKISHPRTIAARPLKRKISPEAKLNRSTSSIVSTLPPTGSNSQCKNLYISFGKTISLQLQQLPLDVAIETMSEIHTMLTKNTLEHFRSTAIPNGHDSYTQSESEDSCSELIEEALNDSS